MNTSQKIFIAGRGGMVGSAIARNLQLAGYQTIVGPNSQELDLTDTKATLDYMLREKPDWVFLAAAKVGGIHANNTYPVDFLLTNLQIQNNVIDAAWQAGVKKLMFMGSSCIYPKFAQQPMNEDELLSGKLEPTNEPYALAKIAGIKLCQAYYRQYGANFISVMPTNLYGLGDNYHPDNSHVIPGLIQRFHRAKVDQLPQVTVWGTGSPKREFLFADDLGQACVFLMENYNSSEIVNIGTGVEVTIKELAETVKDVVGFPGQLIFDTTKPDGTPRKLLDVGKLTKLGWQAKTKLREGLQSSYQDFLANTWPHFDELYSAKM